ncbi:MAG: molybdenum cofactor guanylyltransferase MobA [Cypionkella sp.]
MRIFGVILAGGGGRRMGGVDKAALILGGERLIARAIARLEPQVERLALSANGDPARFGFGLPVLPDAAPLGPLAGILAALRWAAPLGATAVVSVAVDTPFFPGDLTPRLCLAAESAPEGLALAASVKDHPTCALWPVTLLPALEAFLASGVNPRVLAFADAHHAARARFPDEAAFANINTPEDLTAAEARLKGAA